MMQRGHIGRDPDAFWIWPSGGKVVASNYLCWSLFVVSYEMDGRDGIHGATVVYSSEAQQWENGGNAIYMEARVCLFWWRDEHA